MTRVVIAGDSHIASIKRGCSRWLGFLHSIKFLPLGPGDIVLEEFFSVDAKRRHVTVQARDRKPVHFPVGNSRMDLYVVSLPLNTSRILRDYDWRRYVPWYLAKSPQEIPLSKEAMSRLIRADAGRAIAFVSALSDIGLNIVVVEAPAYFEDADYLQGRRMDVQREIAALYHGYVRERLAEKGIGVISQPAITLTAARTTDMAYNHEDPRDIHHANAAFGRLMLNEIIKTAKVRRPNFKLRLRNAYYRARRAVMRIPSRLFSLARA